MNVDLSEEESAALIRELADFIGNDRYPFSTRIRSLKAILAKLRPEPVQEPCSRRRCTRHRAPH
jgi:hypothetical protein